MQTIHTKSLPRAFVKERNGRYLARRPLAESDILDQAKSIIASRFRDKPFVGNVTDARDFVVAALGNEPRETFAVCFTDNQNRLLAFEIVGLGTINRCDPSFREVVRRALVHNAAAVILVHNHPSGNAKPSMADLRLTARLRYLLEFLDVRVLDHLIVGGTSVFSFVDENILDRCRCDDEADWRAIGKKVRTRRQKKRGR